MAECTPHFDERDESWDLFSASCGWVVVVVVLVCVCVWGGAYTSLAGRDRVLLTLPFPLPSRLSVVGNTPSLLSPKISG